jgi:hypothetical protein
MHKRALETREPSCVTMTAFLYSCGPQPAGSCGTRGSTGAHLVKEARSRDEGHVVAPELTSARRRGPGPWDTWWRRSPPLQGSVVRSYSLRGSAWMYALLLVLT